MVAAKEYEKENSIHFSYYCLLSGQDYLLANVNIINEQLQKSYPKPYIDCTPWAPGNWVCNGAIHSVWYLKAERDIRRFLPYPSIIEKIVRSPFWLCNKAMRRFSNAKYKLEKKDVKLYGGSAWWILPDDMVSYLLKIKGGFSKKSKYFPLIGVAVPEENYYQTVLMNSEFSGRIEVNPPEMVAQNCKTYANFSPAGKKFVGHPYIITMEDTNMLKDLAEERFFARKFDEKVDADIFDWIDRNLLCGNSISKE